MWQKSLKMTQLCTVLDALFNHIYLLFFVIIDVFPFRAETRIKHERKKCAEFFSLCLGENDEFLADFLSYTERYTENWNFRQVGQQTPNFYVLF